MASRMVVLPAPVSPWMRNTRLGPSSVKSTVSLLPVGTKGLHGQLEAVSSPHRLPRPALQRVQERSPPRQPALHSPHARSRRGRSRRTARPVLRVLDARATRRWAPSIARSVSSRRRDRRNGNFLRNLSTGFSDRIGVGERSLRRTLRLVCSSTSRLRSSANAPLTRRTSRLMGSVACSMRELAPGAEIDHGDRLLLVGLAEGVLEQRPRVADALRPSRLRARAGGQGRHSRSRRTEPRSPRPYPPTVSSRSDSHCRHPSHEGVPHDHVTRGPARRRETMVSNWAAITSSWVWMSSRCSLVAGALRIGVGKRPEAHLNAVAPGHLRGPHLPPHAPDDMDAGPPRQLAEVLEPSRTVVVAGDHHDRDPKIEGEARPRRCRAAEPHRAAARPGRTRRRR